VEIPVKSLLPVSVAALLSLCACRGREVEIISSAPAAPSQTTATSARPAVPVRVDGRVAGVSSVCPALTFTVSGITVTTSASTDFSGGCAAILNGATVSVTGPRQTDGSIAATRVEVAEAEVTGAMSAVQGTCPVLTFSVAGTSVSASAATILDGLSCAQLTNGTVVRVDGYRQADGSIQASSISTVKR